MTWTDEQSAALSRLAWKIQTNRAENLRKQSFYDGNPQVKNLNISVPSDMVSVAPALGWPSTVVDVIAERMTFTGFSTGADDGSEEVLRHAVRLSGLKLELAKAITDSFTFGVGFLEVIDEGGGRPRAQAVDPMSASFEWDETGREVQWGVVTRTDRNGRTLRTLFEKNQTTAEEVDAAGQVVVGEPVVHNRGIAGLRPVLNRMRSGRARGHSEITEAVRYAVEHAVRVLIGMEYNREIYTAPHRWMTNVYPDDVGMDVDNPQERKRKAFNASMTHYVVVPPAVEEESGSLVQPSVGQFSSSPPSPYIEELRAMTQLIAAEAAIPVHYLGFITDNPASAEAINAGEARLVKKAELRQAQFGQDLVEAVAPLLWHIVTGYPMPDEVRAGLYAMWVNPATPTQAAMSDAGSKMVGSKILPPRSSVLYDMLGFDQQQQRQIERDWARDTSRALVGDLQARAQEARDASSTVEALSSTTEETDWGDTG